MDKPNAVQNEDVAGASVQQRSDRTAEQLKSSFLDELFETSTLLCYLGFIFFMTGFFCCLIGPLLPASDSVVMIENVGISIALLAGMGVSFLVMGSKRGNEGFSRYSRKPIVIASVSALALLFPLCWLVSVYLDSYCYPLLYALSFASGASVAFFFVAWQMLCWSLSIWSFVRFLGVTSACSLILFVVVKLTLIVVFQFALTCFLFVISGAVLYTIGGGKRADYVIVRDDTSRLFTFEKRVDAVYMLLHAVGGLAMVLLLAFYGLWFLCAPLIAAAFLIFLLIITRNRQNYQGAFILREMRLYIAVQIFSLILLVIPLDAVRIAALSTIVASWLTLQAFQGIFLERFLGFGPTSVYYICVSGFNMNVSLLVGIVIGVITLASVQDVNTALTGVLVVASAVILIDAQFLPYEKTLDINVDGSADDEAETMDEDEALEAQSGSVAHFIGQRSEELARTYQLSKRETEVLPILARGSSAKYIANTLGISEHTARVHVYHIYKKVGVHSRQALIDLFDYED